MDASEQESRCQAAAEYYYDLLHRDEAAVPEWVGSHVEGCPFCREQMRRLGEVLSEANRDAGSSARPTTVETVVALSGHLKLVDEPLTCSQVKAFLPSLAAPAPEIRIPTPVTAHADHCPQCAEDLATLRALGLRSEQLERLSRVFRESSRRSPMACRRARPAVAALGWFALGDIDAQSLDHISTCPRCRAAMYRRRARLAAALEPGATSCTRTSAADLFELAVPYGRAPAGAEESREILMHVRACPLCVERMQALHRTLYGIAERADSGVTTVYSTHGTDECAGGEPGGTLSRYPVHVQIARGEPEPPARPGDLPATRYADATGRPAGSKRLSLAKIAVAAAAFALVSLLFTITPAASGTYVRDILKAVQRQPNIRVRSFHANNPEPFQICWVARDLNVVLVEKPGERVLYDFTERSKKIVDLERGTQVTLRLAGRDYQSAERTLMGYTAGIFADIPSDTELHELADPAGASEPGALVYEPKTPARQYADGNMVVFSYRYRVSIDPVTKLPQRFECLRKGSQEDDEWKLSSCQTFEYVSERDVRDAIKAMRFGP